MPEYDFADKLLAWHRNHGRHDLPWQHPRSAYRVWVSEIMLQQTQVRTVIPYFNAFMANFPDLPALAKASADRVMQAWAGLGYYSRARNLHAAAKRCVELHGGCLPEDFEALLALPGIGRSTAGAILSQAHGGRHAVLDGNVKRVLSRVFTPQGEAGSSALEKRLWLLAESLLPGGNMADYTQGLMDLGATLCTRSKPRCTDCPLRSDCRAYHADCIADFPARKKRAPLPQQERYMLVLRDPSNRVLMQRRPETGLWGGLYSLPEAETPQQAENEALSYAPLLPSALALSPILHGFSHYRLLIKPLLWDVPAAMLQIRDNDASQWIGLDTLDQHGLPAPIRKLLKALP